MKDFRNIKKTAQEEFPLHTWIRIRIKNNPSNPYNNMIFEKFIRDSKDFKHTQYALYIHDTYLSIRSLQFENFVPIKLVLDSKLWVELYSVFETDFNTDDNYIFNRLQNINDKPYD